MALESATYISDLVSSNPEATDNRGQGDDHLRLIKAAVKGTFPNATKKFYFPQGSSAQTSTVTVTTSDDNKLIPVNCQSGAITVNLPQGSTLWDGFSVRVVKADHSNNELTVDGYASETINGNLTEKLWQRYQMMKLQYVEALSAWLADITYVPPIGVVNPFTSVTVPNGWLLANGQTIGDASSGATGRANADCRGLFYHLWANYSNSICAVSTGRGVSAAADFDAHKTIALLDYRGRSHFGTDDMGASAASRLGNVITDETTLGAAGGAEQITLVQANLPDVTLSGTVTGTASGTWWAPATASRATGSGGFSDGWGGGGLSGAISLGVTGSASVDLGGSDTPISNLPPAILGSWIIKL